MDPQRALLLEFQPLIHAELTRIGFFGHTDPSAEGELVPFVGMDRPFTRESLGGFVAELRSVPTGAGRRGFFLHFGVDPDDLDDRDASTTT